MNKLELVKKLNVRFTQPYMSFFSARQLAEQILKVINDEPVDSWFQSYIDEVQSSTQTARKEK